MKIVDTKVDTNQAAVSAIAIYCPNCGRSAERFYSLAEQLTRTQCGHCDYLMVTCERTGNVIEAYAPGYSLSHHALTIEARS